MPTVWRSTQDQKWREIWHLTGLGMWGPKDMSAQGFPSELQPALRAQQVTAKWQLCAQGGEAQKEVAGRESH